MFTQNLIVHERVMYLLCVTVKLLQALVQTEFLKAHFFLLIGLVVRKWCVSF